MQGLEPWASCSQSRRATNCATPRYEVKRSGWAYSPKCRALPVELHPDIHFSAMIPRRAVKIKFFLSVVIYVVKAAFVPLSAAGAKPANARAARLCGVSPCSVPDTATALPNIVRLFTFAAIPAIAMLRKSLRWFHRRLSGSGRRIRTLTYGVRVRCATITQSRYVLTNKDYYTHFSEFVNTFFTFFGIVLQTVPFAFFRAL